MAEIPHQWLAVQGTQKFVKQGNASGRDLRGADLTDIRLERVDVSGADLRDADLANFRAVDVSFEGANFVGAAVVGARFHDCMLADANFAGCLMDQILLGACTCTDANFEDASLRGADVTGTIFSQARMARVDLRRAIAPHAAFDDADLTDADLSGGNFEKAYFRRTRLTGVRWDGANLKGARFDAGAGAQMLDNALSQNPQCSPSDYSALACEEGDKRWYVIERRAERKEAIRVDPPEQTADGLVLPFTLAEMSLPPLVAYALIVKVLLLGLLADTLGATQGPKIFHDKAGPSGFVLPA